MRTEIEKLTWPNWVVKVYDNKGVMREMHFTYTKWGAKNVETRLFASKRLKNREWSQ